MVPGGHLSVILVVIIGFWQWGVRKGQGMAQNGPRLYIFIIYYILTFPDLPLPKTNNNHQYNTQVTARYHCHTFPTIWFLIGRIIWSKKCSTGFYKGISGHLNSRSNSCENVIARYFVLCRLYLRDKEQDDIGNVYHIKKLETDSEQGQEELDVSKTLLNLEHKLKITKTPF